MVITGTAGVQRGSFLMSPDPASEKLSGPSGLQISPAKLESVISQTLAPFKDVDFIQITWTQAGGINPTSKPHSTICSLHYISTVKVTVTAPF